MKGSGKLVAQHLGIDTTNQTLLLATLQKMPVEKLTSNHVCTYTELHTRNFLSNYNYKF